LRRAPSLLIVSSKQARLRPRSVIAVVLLGGFSLYTLGAIPFLPRSVADVKYSVIDDVGSPLVCTGWGQGNPPFRPVQTYPAIVADVPTYVAILRRLHLPGVLTPDQVLSVYREWLRLAAIRLDRHGALYDFAMWPGRASSPAALRNEVVGKVDLYGDVSHVHTGTAMGACLL
jgi:hypothetical protein